MKEALLNWLGPVIEHPYCQEVIQNDFLCGVIAGVLLVLLLRLLVWIIFRRRSCQTINVANDYGTVTISANAVFSVIKNSCSLIKCLEISKLEIFRKKDAFDFHLRAVMDAGQGTTPQLMEKVALIVRKEMTAVFGMDNIGEIKLLISNCKRLNGSEEEETEEFPDFIDAVENSGSKDSEKMVSLRHRK